MWEIGPRTPAASTKISVRSSPAFSPVEPKHMKSQLSLYVGFAACEYYIFDPHLVENSLNTGGFVQSKSGLFKD